MSNSTIYYQFHFINFIIIQYTMYVVDKLAAIENKNKVLIVSSQWEESDFCLFILYLVILLISGYCSMNLFISPYICHFM